MRTSGVRIRGRTDAEPDTGRKAAGKEGKGANRREVRRERLGRKGGAEEAGARKVEEEALRKVKESGEEGGELVGAAAGGKEGGESTETAAGEKEER